ncbi:hypothetical protein POTOM_009670 [Populus tomentosa]|uniref:Protodermal factor 1 n=1 Tax=Populus tomentosa TaxID=118781 RepID=A0A8X8A6P8_POPTO|nr:hypothetical protein POTOM_009670 [Populus tomentosa]
MEKQESKQASMLMWVLAVGLLSHNLAFPVLATTFEDQKNYYSPDPHSRSPPSGLSLSLSLSLSRLRAQALVHTGPLHMVQEVALLTHHLTQRHQLLQVEATIQHHQTLREEVDTTPPLQPQEAAPQHQSFYWRTHPALIGGVLGWWGTMGNAFGVTSLPGFGTSMTLQQALSNTRTDGYGTLYREGTASLLNSMVSNRFPFTTRQVRENFVASLASNKAAGAQGHLFKLANEGRLKPRV